jgi:hypothetical protein
MSVELEGKGIAGGWRSRIYRRRQHRRGISSSPKDKTTLYRFV